MGHENFSVDPNKSLKITFYAATVCERKITVNYWRSKGTRFDFPDLKSYETLNKNEASRYFTLSLK